MESIKIMESRQATISAADQGPLLNVVKWIMLVVMVFAVLIKVSSKYIVARTLQLDDFFMLAALLFAAGTGIAISVQVSAGLGRHIDSLGGHQMARYEQATFTSQLLYTLSLCMAKLAILRMLTTLAREGTRRNVVLGIMLFTTVTAAAEMFAIAFQCPVPDTWEILSSRCFDQTAFWNAYGTLDALIDLLTVILPVYLLYDLQMRRKFKIPAMLSFASRTFIIPFIVARLVYLNRAAHSTDATYDDFDTALFTTIHVNVNVIITCVPFLKPVIDRLNTGILTSDVHSLVPFGAGSSSATAYASRRWKRSKPGGSSMALSKPGTINSRIKQREPSGTSSNERIIIEQRQEVSLQYSQTDGAK